MAGCSIIKRLVPLSVLAALLYAPPHLLEQYLGHNTANTAWPNTVQPIIKALIGLAIVRIVNAGLSSLATNNWRVSSSPPTKKWDWPNEIAVVTGGCGGIGLALVEGLTAKGVRVAVLDIQDAPPALAANSRATYFKCDITSRAAVEEAGRAVRRELGGDPSILINNAGLARSNTILEVPEDALRGVLSVNLMSHWFTVQEFLPAMVRANKGHVVSVASLASFVALPHMVEYCATKAGVLAFHEGLTSEIKHVYRAPGIQTTVIHPNFVKTPMTAPYADRIERTQKMLTVPDISRPLLAQIFSGRGGQLVMPANLTFISTLRGWPHWLQEGLRDVLGASSLPKA